VDNDSIGKFSGIPVQTLCAVFDGSFDGFLTVVFRHYDEKICPSALYSEESFQQSLDTDYIYIDTDEEKARRVFSGIKKNISLESAENLYNTFLADQYDDRFTSMYIYTLIGFKIGRAVESYYQSSHVAQVLKLSKKVTGEAHSYLGFLRFAETEQGFYYAAFEPKSYVLPIVAQHFADRLGPLRWIIHDKKRGLAAVWDGEAIETRQVGFDAKVELSSQEEIYRELWLAFFESITVEGRKNAKLQQGNLPKRYRHYVTEFKP